MSRKVSATRTKFQERMMDSALLENTNYRVDRKDIDLMYLSYQNSMYNNLVIVTK